MATTAAPPASNPPAAPRAQLIHIETDRRLGHEWDEWDGKPLPGNGDFSAPAGIFFGYAGLTLLALAAVAGGILYLLAPRLATVWPALPLGLAWALAAAGAAAVVWFGLLLASYYGGRNLLPEGALERGPFLHIMNFTSGVARLFGRRDWVEHAAIDVYNTLAVRRGRKVG